MNSTNGSVPRLKSLELQGYKTFAHKTTLELASRITAVVGPNGTGKSNIADAIRWVLGEQAYSLLRGKRTEDMIFSGSEERARAGMASATITFDNGDGWLPIDFTEVTISRRAYRDGQNEYFLNGQRVRLRDITELLAQSGLAERTYTIIGQGLVDAALSLKAEERRELFEEAAGIGLYRSRREEALRRLDNTRRNLERAQDILGELRPRLKRLGRQASRAQTYRQVKEDLHKALRNWYGYHWHNMLEVLAQARRRADESAEKRTALLSRQRQCQESLRDTRHHIDRLRDQLHAWSQEISAQYAQREALGRRVAVAEERLRAINEQIDLVRTEVESLEQGRAEVEARLKHARQDVGERLQELGEAQTAVNELRAAGEADSSTRKQALERVHTVRKALEDLAERRAARTAEVAHVTADLETRTTQLNAVETRLLEEQEEVARLEEHRAAKHEAWQKARDAKAQAQRVITDFSSKLDVLQSQRDREQNRIPDLHTALAKVRAQLDRLREELEGPQAVVDAVSQAARSNQVSGFVGRLMDQVRVDPRYMGAVTAALGEFARGLMLQSPQDVDAILDHLEMLEQEQGAALLSLETLTSATPLQAPEVPGCLGTAVQLVHAPPVYQAVLEHLLGRTIITRDRETARRLLINLPADARVVTLKGDVFHPSGAVLAGPARTTEAKRAQAKALGASAAGEVRRLENARADLEQQTQQIASLKTDLEQARDRLARSSAMEREAQVKLEAVEYKLDESRRVLEDIKQERSALGVKMERLQERLEELQGQEASLEDERRQLEAGLQRALAGTEQAAPSLEMTRAEAQVAVAERALAEAQRRVEDFEGRSSVMESDLQAWKRRLVGLREEKSSLPNELSEVNKQLKSIESEVGALKDKVGPAEMDLQQAEKERAELEARESELRIEFHSVEEVHSQSQIDLARRQEEMVGLRRRIEDDFGLITLEMEPDVPGQAPLPLEGLVERLPRMESLPPDLEDHVSRLRAQLRRIGSVNLEAQREYDEVSERVGFLTTQVDDLRRAETQIQEIIAELDLLMEREFRKTFDAVAVAFRKAFKRLFGGGSARLVLSNPDDLTNTGIDIEARLPGRREQGLAMLSGGERSLTASALIFALLEVSPTPFCVLDEVDAMLDEANVLRFSEMLRELSQQTQFIVITHNRLTVQAADVIYGVSMEQDSISRVISLQLDEAERELAA
jgi:chromosome segregation protein